MHKYGTRKEVMQVAMMKSTPDEEMRAGAQQMLQAALHTKHSHCLYLRVSRQAIWRRPGGSALPPRVMRGERCVDSVLVEAA